VPERMDKSSIQAQGRYHFRPSRHVDYKEDPSDDITSKDYACGNAAGSIDPTKSKMSSLNDSTSGSEWTTDDESFVTSDSYDSMDSEDSYAPSRPTEDNVGYYSSHSSSVAGSDYQACMLRENLRTAGTRKRKSSTDQSSCSGFSFVSDDADESASSDDAYSPCITREDDRIKKLSSRSGYDNTDSSSDESITHKLPVLRLKQPTSHTR
jgi:hypothetical protein